MPVKFVAAIVLGKSSPAFASPRLQRSGAAGDNNNLGLAAVGPGCIFAEHHAFTVACALHGNAAGFVNETPALGKIECTSGGETGQDGVVGIAGDVRDIVEM